VGLYFWEKALYWNQKGGNPVDQIKIGGFIAQERKRKKLTQQQLADILGISNKTVSKWECGGGMPEISLLLPLCQELEISVNELLSGERLDEEEYRQKAEENMMNFMQEREENKKKFWLTFSVGIVSTVSFITLMIIAFIYADVIGLSVRILLVAIAVAVFAFGLYVAMDGERTIGFYKCRRCGEKFVPDFGRYTMAVHVWTARRMKCPHCGKKSWCKKVMGRED